MIVRCCVCQRVRLGEIWVRRPRREDELASHGYCPDCAAIARVELALLQLKADDDVLSLPASAVA